LRYVTFKNLGIIPNAGYAYMRPMFIIFLSYTQGYEQCPDEMFADGANFEDENNYPIPTNIAALKEWRKKDFIARTMIYHTNDKERQKGE
jgi:hypothetical protein